MHKREIDISVAGSLSFSRGILEQLAVYCYEYREEPFTLSSGRKSHDYVDCRRLALSSQGHVHIGRVFWAMLKLWSENHSKSSPIFDGLAAVALGGCPIASATSTIAGLVDDNWPVLYVRKTPKDHGANQGNLVEGAYAFSAASINRVVLLEDVLTSGGSALQAIETIEKAGFDVVHTMALVDREEGAREAFQAKGRQYNTLFTLSQIKEHLAVMKERGLNVEKTKEKGVCVFDRDNTGSGCDTTNRS